MKAKTAIEAAMMKTAPITSVIEGTVVEWRPCLFTGCAFYSADVLISTEHSDVRMASEEIPVGARVRFTQTKYCDGSTKNESLEVINLNPACPEFPHFITTIDYKGRIYDLYYGHTPELTGKPESRYVEVIESITRHGFLLLPEDFKFVFHRKLPRLYHGHATCYIGLVYQSKRMESRTVSHGYQTVDLLGRYDFKSLTGKDDGRWSQKNIWLLMKLHG